MERSPSYRRANGIGAATVRVLEDAERAGCGVRSRENTGLLCRRHQRASRPRRLRARRQGAGGIDILVNNAGRAARKPATELTSRKWNEVLDVNLTADICCFETRASLYEEARAAALS